MIINADGEYDIISESEMEALDNVAMHHQVKDGQVFCDNDLIPALVVSKILALQRTNEDNQRCHIFNTKVGI